MDMPSDPTLRSGTTAPHPLDAVVWNALTSSQSHLAEGDALAKRFPADLAPFGAVADVSPAAFRSLHALLRPGQRMKKEHRSLSYQVSNKISTALLPDYQPKAVASS